MPFWFWAVVVFVYGTIVGSFLNVCIWRMPHDESIVNPPSHCPKCNTRLRLLDLVPMLSFLLLGRKCRYCGAPIGWRYFTVELITALTFLALFAKYRVDVIDFVTLALFSAALIAVVFIDLEHWIIPDQLSVFGIVLGVARDVVGVVMADPGHKLLRIPVPFTEVSIPMLQSVAGLVICGALFYLISAVGTMFFGAKSGDGTDGSVVEDQPARPGKEKAKKRAGLISANGVRLACGLPLIVVYIASMVSGYPWLMGLAVVLYLMVEVIVHAMYPAEVSSPNDEPIVVATAEELGVEDAMGGGDIKLAAAIGAVVGVPLALLSFFMAVFIGSLLGISFAIVKRQRLRGMALAFGPMMVAGVLSVLFFGQQIIDWYAGILNRGGL